MTVLRRLLARLRRRRPTIYVSLYTSDGVLGPKPVELDRYRRNREAITFGPMPEATTIEAAYLDGVGWIELHKEGE